MGTATPVKFGGSNRSFGEFKVERFNLFDEDSANAYAELRTRANNASSGIRVEMIKEYTRKTTIREGAGEDALVTTTEEVFLVVHYWVKDSHLEKGDSQDDVQKSKKEFSIERKVE